MSDPTTPLKVLAVPSHGSDVDTWDQPLNNDFTAIDGILGGLVTKSLTNANVTLTAPAGSVTPGAGPTESQNAIIRFTGTLTGNCIITIPLPGFYIAENLCTVGAFYVQVRGATATQVIGLPPGQAIQIYTDGSNVRFVGMPAVSSLMMLSVTSAPAWMGACTVRPWLVCDGTVYNTVDYQTLGAMLGSTFGGNGSTTFGVPDLGNRNPLMIGSRITSVVSGVDGATRGAAGGSQSHTLTAAESAVLTYTDSGHTNPVGFNQTGTGPGSVETVKPYIGSAGNYPSGPGFANITANAGGGAHTIVNPVLIFGTTFIKT